MKTRSAEELPVKGVLGSSWSLIACLGCILGISVSSLAQEKNLPPGTGPVAKIQSTAVSKGFSEVAHWGSNPMKYSQWTSHSNRLVPVYTFGTAQGTNGISLASYIGANSAYRNPDALKKIYGIVPKHTVNPSAEYMDQTNIFDLQHAALAAGKKRIILMIFDGMGWEATRAAAIYRSGTIYRSGRGNGLHFLDYQGAGKSEFGLMCTSPTSARANVENVDEQTVNIPECYGGYDPSRGGFAPWETMPDKEYIKGPDHARNAHVYTDSSASATSMCSGIKSYNYAINVSPTGKQTETIAHRVQKMGYKVGVVTSVPIPHATPASAYAHNVSRKDFQDLTRDMVGLKSVSHPDTPLPGLDLILGAGWGITDTSEKAIASERKAQGKNYVPGPRYLTDADRKAIDQAHGGKYVLAERTAGVSGKEVLQVHLKKALAGNHRLLGMFGIPGLGEGHLPFAGAEGDYAPTPDRSNRLEQVTQADINENPTLSDMTETALDYLAQGNGRFWLMVEAGDVDWAMHANNLDAMIGAIYSGDAAFKRMTQWIETHGGWDDTVLIVTADHDHYLVLEKPEALVAAKQRD
jgi:alkaline phosphatase